MRHLMRPLDFSVEELCLLYTSFIPMIYLDQPQCFVALFVRLYCVVSSVCYWTELVLLKNHFLDCVRDLYVYAPMIGEFCFIFRLSWYCS